MNRKYTNPPIVEAVCKFRLTPETEWDLTIPGLLYGKLKEVFPQKEQYVIQEVELTQGSEGLQKRIRTSERIMFFTNDRNMLVQVGTRLLVVNALKSYPHWEGFKSYIEMAWRSLQDTVEVRGLECVGLHYVNHIELPSQSVELSEYFEFYPSVSRRFSQQMSSFTVSVELSYADGRDCCRVRLAPIVGSEGKSLFLLDIDYFVERSCTVEVANALAWIEEAHGRVREIFEGCVTDKLREVFAKEA